MAPHNIDEETSATISVEVDGAELQFPPPPPMSAKPPRVLIIGAGSRGNVYARCIRQSSNGIVVAIAEPDEFKRRQFARNFIRGREGKEEEEDDEGTRMPPEGSEFADWREFVAWETARRERAGANAAVSDGVDAAFVCVRDEMHRDVVVALAPLGLHIMCEKPLATTLGDCVACTAPWRRTRRSGST